ncbi:MAG: isoprenylcysteine carboxylmethyltransferase family protein [Betaproteobacteria bacterium]|nr:isoprenylcysteine carboxylmethyltransferase family protein [Betaproteobacteria bacterium]
MIFARALILSRRGINALVRRLEYDAFGIYYLVFTYAVLACSFSWPFPSVIGRALWHNPALSWAGVLLCLVGTVGYGLCIASLKESFRIGIDENTPGNLITGGIFSYSRNPLYLSLLTIYLGLLLVFANGAMAVNLSISVFLILRQIFREEKFLLQYHGERYAAYCQKTGRFFGRS